MTKEERKAVILPHDRDPELGFDEYYVEDAYGKIQKGWVTSIAPCDQDTMYRVVNGRGVINSGYGMGYTEGWFYKGMMYDNKEDCRNRTHTWHHYWEDLR